MQHINDLEYVNCDICGKKDNRIFMKIGDYQYGTEIELCVVKCNNCGLLFTNPRLGEKAANMVSEKSFWPWDKNKSEAAKRSSRFIRRHPRLRKIWHKFTGEYLGEMIERSKGKVLDLGCGFGDILEDLTRKGCDAFGVETNPVAVEACLEKGLKVYYGTLEGAHFENESFDTVILCHVIEHLPYPQAALKEIRRILKPEGLALIYCPNADSYFADFFGKYWQGWAIPLHFYHFTPSTIKNLVDLAGFEVNRIRAVTPEYVSLGSLNLIIKNKGGALLRGLQNSGVFSTVFFRLGVAFTTRIIDLLLNGKGECLRVELKKKKDKN